MKHKCKTTQKAQWDPSNSLITTLLYYCLISSPVLGLLCIDTPNTNVAVIWADQQYSVNITFCTSIRKVLGESTCWCHLKIRVGIPQFFSAGLLPVSFTKRKPTSSSWPKSNWGHCWPRVHVHSYHIMLSGCDRVSVNLSKAEGNFDSSITCLWFWAIYYMNWLTGVL